MSRKYGSFDVEIAYYNDGERSTQTHTVPPLNQQELSNGWRLVLPRKRIIDITRKNDNGDEVNVRRTNESFFKINLSQLPPHLFGRLKNVYRRGQLIQYTARDNCYVYIVNPTPVDKHIRTLFRYCQLHDEGLYNFEENNLDEIRESLSSVNQQEIKGWVVMKSNRLFGSL